MGACISTWMILDSDHNVYVSSSSAANVITVNGQLRQFQVPITASQLLVQLESQSPSSYVVCNSDSLYYDEHIPAMDSSHELQAGQIYFVLPNSKLKYPLSASDMAALAVKASAAISSINNDSKISSTSQISPLVTPIESVSERDTTINTISNTNMNTRHKRSPGGALGISRSGSMGKLQRYSSRRVKLAARSFKRLTTIHEGFDL